MLSATVLKDITPRRLGFPKKKKISQPYCISAVPKITNFGYCLKTDI